jgi:hypothetical protein
MIFERGQKMKPTDIIAIRDARMADTKRLIELTTPLKQQIESAVAAGKPVSGVKWRRLSRHLQELSDNLSEMAALEQMRQAAVGKE